jgi:hypothetical protein
MADKGGDISSKVNALIITFPPKLGKSGRALRSDDGSQGKK